MNDSSIIHFGMAKTGSTAIQAALHVYFRRPHPDCAYIRGSRINSNDLVELLYRAKTAAHEKQMLHKFSVSEAGLKRLRERLGADLAGQLARLGRRRLIFSSEIIPSLNEPGLARLRARLSGQGRRPLMAVGYVRPPKSHIESAFQQSIKVRYRPFDPMEIFPRHQDILARIENVFGRKQVAFWLFEPATFANGCVVQDFSRKVGLVLSDGAVVQRENDGLSRPAVGLLYAYRKFYPDNLSGPLSARTWQLVRELRQLDGDKFHIHSDFMIPLMQKWDSQIRWMEERMDAQFPDLSPENDAIAIRSESDLLAFSPETLEWLSSRLRNKEIAEEVLSGKPEAVAKGMRQLESQCSPMLEGIWKIKRFLGI